MQSRAFAPSLAKQTFLAFADPASDKADPRAFASVLKRSGGKFSSTGENICEGTRQALLRLPALPDTADEVRQVGSSFSRSTEDLMLGEAFTDEAVKDRRDLNDFKVLYFATHGLVAGDVNQVQRRYRGYPPPPPPPGGMVRAGTETAARERLGGFYLYPLPERTTIADKQTKQVSFLDVRDSPAARAYEYRNGWLGTAEEPRSASSVLRFSSARGGGLGDALPAGTVRVYQRDARGNPHAEGEDGAAHRERRERSFSVLPGNDGVCHAKRHHGQLPRQHRGGVACDGAQLRHHLRRNTRR